MVCLFNRDSKCRGCIRNFAKYPALIGVSLIYSQKQNTIQTPIKKFYSSKPPNEID